MDITNEIGEVRRCFNNSRIKTMKGSSYFSTYEKYFSELKKKKDRIKFLEIGIWNGGSIDMWKTYFEDKLELHMVDINPNCLKLNYRFPDVKIHIGDQSDSAFLRSIVNKYGNFDIILDDGGHTMTQQNITFDTLFPHVNPGGIFICEDLHTSYWNSFGGGFLREGTFIETIKRKIDELNAYQSEDPRLSPTYFTRNCIGIHVTPSMVVFEKSWGEVSKVVDICVGSVEL